MVTAPPRRGRLAALVSPTLLALVFSLLMVLCQRQNMQMDPYVIHPLLAGRLGETFGAIALFCGFAAGFLSLWLILRGKGVEHALAVVINGFAGLFALMNFCMVA